MKTIAQTTPIVAVFSVVSSFLTVATFTLRDLTVCVIVATLLCLLLQYCMPTQAVLCSMTAGP